MVCGGEEEKERGEEWMMRVSEKWGFCFHSCQHLEMLSFSVFILFKKKKKKSISTQRLGIVCFKRKFKDG